MPLPLVMKHPRSADPSIFAPVGEGFGAVVIKTALGPKWMVHVPRGDPPPDRYSRKADALAAARGELVKHKLTQSLGR